LASTRLAREGFGGSALVGRNIGLAARGAALRSGRVSGLAGGVAGRRGRGRRAGQKARQRSRRLIGGLLAASSTRAALARRTSLGFGLGGRRGGAFLHDRGGSRLGCLAALAPFRFEATVAFLAATLPTFATALAAAAFPRFAALALGAGLPRLAIVAV